MPTTGLSYLDVEISYGSQWISLNDGFNFRIAAEGTRDSTAKSWRRTTAESPILGGTYLIHAVPDMVVENVAFWVYGQDQTDLADNFYFAEDLFEQLDFRMRWTYDDYREYWRCQLPDGSFSRGHIWTHSVMAMQSYQVPRFPNVTRERLP